MKKTAAILALLILFLVILVWWLGSRSATKPFAETPPADSAPVVTKITPSAPREMQATSGGPTGASAAKPKVTAQLQQIMNDANRPISFFGVVIDQDANPIPGVKVTLQIRRTKEVGPVGIGDTFDYPFLTTDEDGRFTLTGANGALLAIKSLEKPGYEPSLKALRSSYWYWREPKDAFHPNAERPEVFRMWKKTGAERLVDLEKMTRIPYDGTPVTFDLLTGDKVQFRGDIRVTLERNPHQITYGQRNYEWTLTVAAVDGGVVESNDEQMYRAPADGYQSQLVVHMSAEDQKWTDEKSVALYFKSRGGKHYGSLKIDVMVGSDKPTTGLSFRSFVNPNGSRNLEYDPLQEISHPANTGP
jgi:hypothetical protein